MNKKILSEQALIYGNVSMPKGFEINRDQLTKDILYSFLKESEFPFSKNYDMLNTYILDHVRLKYKIDLIQKKTWGNGYDPGEKTFPIFDTDPVDLKDSPDFTLLYGVDVKDCLVKIYYDDNRRKGRSWDIELKNNMFIIFPSTNMYVINNEQKESMNFIQTILYEYI
jgi:hypothetical protein|tara:strand:+ start:2491 stop:2994 length:504 start_codon:yes stop_codon:yes gene_type:complete